MHFEFLPLQDTYIQMFFPEFICVFLLSDIQLDTVSPGFSKIFSRIKKPYTPEFVMEKFEILNSFLGNDLATIWQPWLPNGCQRGSRKRFLSGFLETIVIEKFQTLQQFPGQRFGNHLATRVAQKSCRKRFLHDFQATVQCTRQNPILVTRVFDDIF